MDKEFKGYNRVGNPIYENREGVRLCNIKDCTGRAVRLLCYKHSRDGVDYSEYLESIRKPFNTYTLVNDEYYEVTVNNSDIIYKIDKDDYLFAKKHNWFSHGDAKYRYLVTKIKGKTVKFHIEVMTKSINLYKKENDYDKRVIVDHINGNVHDNRRSNLRVRTQSENNMNKVIQSNNTSGVPGVSWYKTTGMWNSKIVVNNESISLGHYYYFRNAVRARIEAEEKHFGEHSLKSRDGDNEYNEYIESILSLPEIEEPVILKVRNNKKNPLGTTKLKNGRFRGRIEKNGKVEQKTFDTLKEAVSWRKEKEKEYYGNNILYSTDKKERQI